MLSDAAAGPTLVGLNVTARVQVAPGSNVGPQVAPVPGKAPPSSANGGARVPPAIATAATPPWLVIEKMCGVELPAMRVPKSKLGASANTSRAGDAALPASERAVV